MNVRNRRLNFRNILGSSTCCFPGSVYDPISARLVEDMGFEVGMMGGSVAALAVLGAPDHILVTLTELAEQTRRICRAVELPVIVDADHGFGNALNVMRTVEEIENAGAAAITIEDTDLPRPFDTQTVRLLPRDESLGRVKAALAARGDPDFVIVGRTSALELADFDEAVRRAVDYEAAGVDAMFLTGVTTREQVDQLARALKGPIILSAFPAAVAEKEFLAERRVRVCLLGHQPIWAGVVAMRRTLEALRCGASAGELEGMPDAGLVRSLTRDAAYARAIDDYLSSGQKGER